MAEAEFIRRLQASATDPRARGLLDDCAVAGDLVLTHDMIVIGTHVLPQAAPDDVAWKLVGVNLSDLAAKGAKPTGVLLGYMLGDDGWDTRFAEGLVAALAHYDTPLLGGDTVSAPPAGRQVGRAIGMTAIGRASHVPVPARSGAQPGDVVWLTGCVGDAMLGWLSDSGQLPVALDDDHPAVIRYRRPAPCLSAGLALAPHVTAMMDVSDGLLLDARRMALASGVTIALDLAAIPVSGTVRDAAATRGTLIDDALVWGDDYELLFTLPAGSAPTCPATRIGNVRMLADTPLLVDGIAPEPHRSLGWQHGNPD